VLDAWANGIPVVQTRPHGSFPELTDHGGGLSCLGTTLRPSRTDRRHSKTTICAIAQDGPATAPSASGTADAMAGTDRIWTKNGIRNHSSLVTHHSLTPFTTPPRRLRRTTWRGS